ncbi:MAG: hypothetical protein ARM1_0572 [Candidatus Micrarchaeota archaeon]|nr:MAG: hypothetical protein ARM1_0572 [Candidatus Micrarchaeota archaeon]
MVKFDRSLNAYYCEICKLHYKDKELAEKCQEWCSTHDSCNLSIAKNSIEALSRRTGRTS